MSGHVCRLAFAEKRQDLAAGGRSAAVAELWRTSATRHRSVAAGMLVHHLRKEGIRGLYKGALPSIIKAAPAAAVTFSAYEAALKVLDRVQHVSHDLLA